MSKKRITVASCIKDSILKILKDKQSISFPDLVAEIKNQNSIRALEIDYRRTERGGTLYRFDHQVMAAIYNLNKRGFITPQTPRKKGHYVITDEGRKALTTGVIGGPNERDETTNRNEILELLKEWKNLILTGAPGTGKTFLAKETALRLFLNKPAGDLTPDEKKKMDGEYKDRCSFVQFHPSYDYTDFVEGLRPKNQSGNIVFERKDGVFKKFCKAALSASAPDLPYVFIIDEINRGEVSKIFGELFFAIDPGYRGKEKGTVETQYQNLIDLDDDKFKDGFYIPENVYIIGTMNDIDRSVESFDFAMRRRFVWREITAEESADNMGLSDISQIVMNPLNEAIAKIPGLNSSYHIGASYFLKKDEKGEIIDPDFDTLWKLRLEPLLKEYLRGMSDADTSLKKLNTVYDDAVHADDYASGGENGDGAEN